MCIRDRSLTVLPTGWLRGILYPKLYTDTTAPLKWSTAVVEFCALATVKAVLDLAVTLTTSLPICK